MEAMDTAFQNSLSSLKSDRNRRQLNREVDQLQNGETSVVQGRIEVCQKQTSVAKRSVIKDRVLEELVNCSLPWSDCVMKTFNDPFLREHLDFVCICDTEPSTSKVCQLLPLVRDEMHIFQLHNDGFIQEELEDEENLAASSNWLLPSAEFQGLWENLIYDMSVKTDLLQYARTTMLFSDRKVDPNIVTWNRLILLHGPPGTGKTSLCKALAHKLSIVLSDRYKYGQLIEINSHSLFSKWFSESGKLVMKMFKKIQDVVADQEALVCVLIDEVESLSASRQSMSGSDPSDAIRVVNSLLTQLDAIKRHPNVLILTTSNITGTIDVAFLDRADIKQYIGPPSSSAIYQIYYSCIQELIKAGIVINNESLLDWRGIAILGRCDLSNSVPKLSLELQNIAKASVGLSGRTLRKLPVIAHAIYVQTPTVTLERFLHALSCSVERHLKEGIETTGIKDERMENH